MSERILVPQLNPNDPEIELFQWLKSAGEKVSKGDALCELVTSKAAFTLDSPFDGFLRPAAPQGQRLNAGALLAEVCESAEEALSRGASVSGAAPKTKPAFSRKALERMSELGLSQEDFSGVPFVTENLVLGRPAGMASTRPLPLYKEREIQALSEAYSSALRSSLTMKVPAKGLARDLDNAGLPLSAWVAKCTATALARNPRFLLAFREELAAPAVDLGYVIDIGDGPRLFLAAACESWTARAWAERILDWSLRLSRREVLPDELGHGRFVLTDLSSQGILHFEPLLVGRQSAILGVGADMEPAEPCIMLTLAFDHRVHDGRSGAQFLREVRTLLLDTSNGME